MKLSLALAKKVSCPLSRSFFERVGKTAIDRSDNSALSDACIEISVALVSEDEIQELNRVYRKKNRPTDVLSFGNFLHRRDVVPKDDNCIDLGELILSPEFIERAAREDGVSFEQEMAYIFSHGVFHLLGFRHCQKMFALQDEIAAAYVK